MTSSAAERPTRPIAGKPAGYLGLATYSSLGRLWQLLAGAARVGRQVSVVRGDSPDSARRRIAGYELPGAGLLLDVFHLAELGVDVDGWLDDVAAGTQPLPHHVQIADSPGRGAPGGGDAPIGKWLGRLADLGYEGRIADEWLG